jgi:hypothetical protein
MVGDRIHYSEQNELKINEKFSVKRYLLNALVGLP